jgi:hypothetical protein
MKAFLFVSALLTGIAGISTHANAANYPWCARYATDGGGENCGFSTFDQCQADVSGIGGYCARNTLYAPSPGPRTRPWYYRLNR